MCVTLLFFALLGCAASVTVEDCSNGDLDFLCRNPEVCSIFISDAEASLCASLADSMASGGAFAPTTSPVPPTPSQASTKGPTNPITRGAISRPVTGAEYLTLSTGIPEIPVVTQGERDSTDVPDMGNMEGVTESNTRGGGYVTGTADDVASTAGADAPDPTNAMFQVNTSLKLFTRFLFNYDNQFFKIIF